MTDFLFIRHGETRANTIGRWEGWTDPPLTPAGRRQAEALADRLTRDRAAAAALYSSPLIRAHQTAQIIGEHLKLEPQLVQDLKEIHFGQLEGISVLEMEERFPGLFARWQDKGDMAFEWPGGERRGDFFERAAAACERIGRRHPNAAVIVVAHGGTIRACLAHLLPDLLRAWWTYKLDNTGVSHVRAAKDGIRLVALNDVSHLADLDRYGKRREGGND